MKDRDNKQHELSVLQKLSEKDIEFLNRLANKIANNQVNTAAIEFAYQGPLIKYKGDVSKIIFKLIGGLKSSMGYLGAKTIIKLRKKVKENDELNQGDRIGMIRFGSRADVYYENYEPLVKVGQKTISGETLLAKK